MSFRAFILKDYMNYYSEKVIFLRKRIQETSSKTTKFFLWRRYNRLLFKCQSFLPLSEAINNDIVFPHGLSGIFISNGATIGAGCVIFQQVTIGSNSLADSKNKGYPVIGNNVYIGAGAKIIGNVEVGNNVRIGANAVVTKDIPENSTVVGSNIIIKHNHILDNSFIVFKEKEKDEK